MIEEFPLAQRFLRVLEKRQSERDGSVRLRLLLQAKGLYAQMRIGVKRAVLKEVAERGLEFEDV